MGDGKEHAKVGTQHRTRSPVVTRQDLVSDRHGSKHLPTLGLDTTISPSVRIRHVIKIKVDT